MRAAAALNEIVVIGGTEIFAQTMALADRLEITHVHVQPEGDVYFPAIDPKLWRETARSEQPAGPETMFASALSHTSVLIAEGRKDQSGQGVGPCPRRSL